MSAPLPGDKSAAYVGFFAGALVIGLFAFGMVKWTNGRFEGHHKNPSAGVPAAQSNPTAAAPR